MRTSKKNDAPSGLEAARRVFSAAGLPTPPVPRRFAPQLREVNTWCFSTRPIDAMAMYFFENYIVEALTLDIPDYVAFSHAGHGINSYALSYHLIDGPLALIVQVGWGGGYMGDAEPKAAVALFQRCEALIASARSAKKRGWKPGPGRLSVFESDLRGVGVWGWLGQSLAGDEASVWLTEHEVAKRSARRPALPTVAAKEWLDKQL